MSLTTYSDIAKESTSAKTKEDVDLIVHEMEIPRADAERLLTKHSGNIEEALRVHIFANS